VKNKTISITALIIILSVFFPTIAYANSSWHWLTKTRPFDILPYVAVLTLILEFLAIGKLNSMRSTIKLFIVICLANLVSFALPYTVYLLPSAVGYTFDMSISHLPLYIVGFGYLLLTLIAEMPIVYISFRKNVLDRKKLLVSIIAVNTATTLLVALIERIFIKGSW
jgi:hypothetical protein